MRLMSDAIVCLLVCFLGRPNGRLSAVGSFLMVRLIALSFFSSESVM